MVSRDSLPFLPLIGSVLEQLVADTLASGAAKVQCRRNGTIPTCRFFRTELLLNL